MGEEYVTREVCNERRCTMDERFARDKADIQTASNKIDTLVEMVTELTALQRTNTEVQQEHEKRIHALEMQPAGKWDKLTTGIIGAIAGGLGTMVINAIIGG